MFLFLNYFSKSFYVLKRHFLILSKYLKEMLFWPSRVKKNDHWGWKIDTKKQIYLRRVFPKSVAVFFGVAYIALSLALDMTFYKWQSWDNNYKHKKYPLRIVGEDIFSMSFYKNYSTLTTSNSNTNGE